MLFTLSTPVLFRHLWQLKTIVFLHWCLMHADLLNIFLWITILIHNCICADCWVLPQRLRRYSKCCPVWYRITSIHYLLALSYSVSLFPMEQHTLRNAKNCLNTNIYSYLETSGCQFLIYIKMLFTLSTPVLFRHLWQLKTIVFLHWCLMHADLLNIFYE